MALKRLFDVMSSMGAVILLSPVLLLVAVAVASRLGLPVLFRQRRVGEGGEPFELVKFRTMSDECDSDGKPLTDGERLDAFGAWLRASSLDELPELWNVLRGEMSLVGPRPLPVAYLDRFSPGQARRHEVPPGLTGWAQVNGRNLTSWDERLAMDVWYVDNRSLWLDLRILARTLLVVLRRDGISAEGEATMGELPPRLDGTGGGT